MALRKELPEPQWTLPTHLDLPAEDGIPMEDRLHSIQATEYLLQPLQAWLVEHDQPAVLGANAFVYYDLKGHPVGPDFFCVNGGVERGQHSWVVWDEGGLYPTCLIELPSPSTEEKDRVTNFRIYETIFRAPDYFIYDVRKFRLEGYHLVEGRYLRILPDAQGQIPCVSLPLKLGVDDGWLRWFESDGSLVPTPAERANLEKARADSAAQRAETEHARALAEQARAAAEKTRADEEKARADQAERRLAELERRLQSLEKSSD